MTKSVDRIDSDTLYKFLSLIGVGEIYRFYAKSLYSLPGNCQISFMQGAKKSKLEVRQLNSLYENNIGKKDAVTSLFSDINMAIDKKSYALLADSILGLCYEKNDEGVWNCKIFDDPKLGAEKEKEESEGDIIALDDQIIEDEFGNVAYFRLDSEDPSTDFKVVPKDFKETTLLPTSRAFEMLVGRTSKEIVKNAMAQGRYGFPTYNRERAPGPYKENVSGVDLPFFNTYLRPFWVGMEGNKKLPGDVSTFLNHLFPIEKERRYFFAWLYMSLTKRAPTCLVLCGTPGVGKNALKQMIRCLHGVNNSVDVPKSVFTSRFNSCWENNTFAFHDETGLTPQAVELVKELVNGSLAIEKKFMDATRSTAVYTSLIVANNYERDIHISFEDRKFACLQMPNKMADAALSKEFMDQFFKDWTYETCDRSKVIDLASHVLAHGPHYCEEFPNLLYRGPRFYEISRAHLTGWQKECLQMVSYYLVNFRKNTPKEKVWWKGVLEYFDKASQSTTGVKIKFFDKNSEKRVSDVNVKNFLQSFVLEETPSFLVEENESEVRIDQDDFFFTPRDYKLIGKLKKYSETIRGVRVKSKELESLNKKEKVEEISEDLI